MMKTKTVSIINTIAIFVAMATLAMATTATQPLIDIIMFIFAVIIIYATENINNGK